MVMCMAECYLGLLAMSLEVALQDAAFAGTVAGTAVGAWAQREEDGHHEGNL